MPDCYPVKAFTRQGDLYEFSATDVPCYINKDEFVLLRKPDSPILQGGLLVRGCDIPGIFEGDILVSEGVEYVVQYRRGFVCKDANKRSKYLYQLKDYERIGSVLDREDCTYTFPKKIYYKYRGNLIFPRSVQGAADNKVIIEGLGVTSHFDEIRQEARISYEDKKLYFGDLVDGYPLELYYGRPVIRHDDVVYDIVSKLNIQGEEKGQKEND